jgi:hypothetical protein
MNNLLSILIFVAVAAQSAFCQSDLPVLDSTDIPDAKITRFEQYDGTSLWGYIDGGADIYLEYGFDKVVGQEISWNNNHLKLEIYRMKDAEAAFGIYSVSHRNCISGKISKFSCATAHQVQFALGRYYVSVVNDNGSEQEQEMGLSLARLVSKKLKGQPVVLPRLFRKGIYSQHTNLLKFVRGNLSIQKAMPDWEDLFDGIKNYSMFVLPVELQDGYINVAHINFKNKKEKIHFLKKLGMISKERKPYQEKSLDGKFRAVKELSPTEVIYLGSNLNAGELKSYLQGIKSQKVK